MPEKTLWEILVPTRSNTGEDYPINHHHAWDSHVREIAGGLTILKTAKGQWISPDGELFPEKMIPVRIHCTREDIEKIVDHTMDHYNQKAVMAYEISTNVILKYQGQK